MIYIFGGVGKTGCSTLAIDFADQFGLRRVYGGAYMKAEAIKANCYRQEYLLPADQNDWDLDQANVPAFREMCERTGRNIDAEIEGYLIREMITSQADERDIVVESKTMSRLLNSDVLDSLIDETGKELGFEGSFSREELLRRTQAIWIHADLEVRAQRAIKPQAVGANTEMNPQQITPERIEHEANLLTARQVTDRADYSRIYKMFDYPVGNEIPPTTYGNILINNGGKESAYAQVLEMMGKAS